MEIKCPKCKSTNLSANKKGFSVGKAVGGAILTGGVGLLAGTIGRGKVQITCLQCGKKFNPGEDYDSVQRRKQLQKELEKKPAYWVFMALWIGFILFCFIKCVS